MPDNATDATSFGEYASSPHLTVDETYTVELLIDRARAKYDPDYWKDCSERAEARQAPDYQPTFSKNDIQLASRELEKLSWVSFQRLGDEERPVRALNALRYLPALSGLVLSNNEVSDFSTLKYCRNLRKLEIQMNPIRDIGPLAGCQNLAELELREAPIQDFAVLQILPALRKLSISVEQIPAFRRLKQLPALEQLEVSNDTFDSFVNFPQMPLLRVIHGANVASLEGLQRFPKLENLVNLSGEFDSLEPLRGSQFLTHANVLSSGVSSLAPLSGLPLLRDLWINTDQASIELSPLDELPLLHEVTVNCSGREAAGLKKLRSRLSSWDTEFLSEKPRHTPSLEVEVVAQDTFDYYDTKQGFNVTDSDKNEGLLTSELEWLDARLESMLARNFEEDEDYTLPFQWGGARSRTVVLLSDRAVEAFPRIVLGLQQVLSLVKKDWIIFLQSDEVGTEFTVWVYPDRIMATETHADTVRELIRRG